MVLLIVVDRILNVSEAIKFKIKIQKTCGINMNMLDTKEDGFVLRIERKTLNANSYKLLADFADQEALNLLLEAGDFILSTHPLHSLG